jgi:hypothetical protein
LETFHGRFVQISYPPRLRRVESKTRLLNDTDLHEKRDEILQSSLQGSEFSSPVANKQQLEKNQRHKFFVKLMPLLDV